LAPSAVAVSLRVALAAFLAVAGLTAFLAAAGRAAFDASTTARFDSTLFGSASTTLYSAAGRAASSRSLISSHGSWRSLSRPCMRTSSQVP